MYRLLPDPDVTVSVPFCVFRETFAILPGLSTYQDLQVNSVASIVAILLSTDCSCSRILSEPPVNQSINQSLIIIAAVRSRRDGDAVVRHVPR